MNERVEQELSLLRAVYPDLDWRGDVLWARIPSYVVPAMMWKQREVEIAFQIPGELPGQAPYGFWVRPGLEAIDGRAISNYTYPVSIPFGDGWGQFSWSPVTWEPKADITTGSNMVNFVRSFADRLREGP